MEHTAGPWLHKHGEIETSNLQSIARVYNRVDHGHLTNISILESQANARLIAVAPVMVDLIERVYLKLLSLGFWEGRGTEEGQTLLSNLRDTIAIVRGRTDEEIQNEFESNGIAKAERKE